MAINLVCPECKSNLSIRSKICKNCGFDLTNSKKYRVVVKGRNGKRTSKVLDSISMAKRYEYEGKLKTQAIQNKLFGIYQIPLVDEVWAKYLSWAKDNKKSWKDDEFRWKHHVETKFEGKKMDAVTAFDVQSVIDEMKSKREYAPATIKHLIVLIRRVFNWAKEMDLYTGDNPALKIKLPKLQQ